MIRGSSVYKALAWAAFGYVIALHLTFLFAVPDPVIGPDSISYLHPALSLLFDHHFNLSPVRTPGYPLFLYFILRFTSSFQAILWVQHALAIGTGFLVMFFCLRLLKLRPELSIAAGFTASVMPLTMIAAHSILTETLYTFLGMLSLSLAFYGFQNKNFRYIAGAVGCGSVALLVRPSGWALLAALGLAIALFWEKRLPGGRNVIIYLVSFALPLLPTYYWNYSRHHFVGLTAFSGVSLFGDTARYLDPAHIQDLKTRETLLPFYQNSALRDRLADGIWTRYAKDGPVMAMRALSPTEVGQDQALQHLALEAITDQPFSFMRDQLVSFVDFLLHRSRVPDIYLDRDFSFFVADGLWLFRSQTALWPKALQFLHDSPDQTRGYLNALEHVKRGSDTEAAAALNDAHQRDIYHYAWVLKAWSPWRFIFPLLSGLALAAYAFGFWLWRNPAYKFPASVLLLYMTLHIALTCLGGDREPRHSIPLEPIYWILFWAGVNQWMDRKVP